MRIINVVEVLNGVVDNIESFGVFEEQLSEEVVEKAEDFFRQKVTEKMQKQTSDVDEIEDAVEEGIENGVWSTEFQEYYDISIIWSDI